MDPSEIEGIAFDAYQFAYPIVMMDATMRQATNTPDATSIPLRAPVNQFAHFREYPAADARDVVRFNFDTLYSFAWLDLSAEPVVLSTPGTDRYYLVPILDMWTDVFAVPGTRTTPGQARHYGLVAPGWTGELPDGVELLQAPTPGVWVMGRTQTNGPADYATVWDIQAQFRLTALSSWGKEEEPAAGVVDPAVDDVTPPMVTVNAMSGVELLGRYADLVTIHPPHLHDHPVLTRMERIGLVRGKPFRAEDLSPEAVEAINRGGAAALADLVDAVTDHTLSREKNNWEWQLGGSYGTNYRHRGMIALAGLGCNLPEDALYASSTVDADGNRFSGEHRYVLRFEAGQQPPAEAFWSLTMYDDEGFQVPNPISRFAIGDRDDLVFGPDGSLELLLQHEQPEDTSNWLPTPKGSFQPLLRMYSPPSYAVRKGLDLPPIRRVG